MEEDHEDIGDGWTRVSRSEVVEAWRGGWLGVWDSIVAWYKGGTRPTYKEQMTFSIYVKPTESVLTFNAQICTEETEDE